MSTSLPSARGPVSAMVLRMLRGGAAEAVPPFDRDVLTDGDVQLALWCLLELHHRGLDGVDPALEWEPEVIRVRQVLEEAHETALRELTRERLSTVDPADELAAQIDALIAADEGPALAEYLRRHADVEQFRAFLRQRSIYHLKESDPHAFVIPRIDGRAKVALAELQYDEFGAGRPAALHSTLFADALAASGLDPTYGAHLEEARALTLAVNTTMSLFGLHRRLRAAAMGHLAAFESTSSASCRRIAAGARRLGMPAEVAVYYDEHVEADAVHEQVAVRGICTPLVEAEPELRADVLFGVAACLELDAVAAREQMDLWSSSLHEVSA